MVKLNKNSWHYRLQNYALGTPPQYNFCPYFWLTILSLFVAPLKFIMLNTVGRVLNLIEFGCKKVDGYIDRKRFAWVKENLTAERVEAYIKGEWKIKTPWFVSLFKTLDGYRMLNLFSKYTEVKSDVYVELRNILWATEDLSLFELYRTKPKTRIDKVVDAVARFFSKYGMFIKMIIGKLLMIIFGGLTLLVIGGSLYFKPTETLMIIGAIVLTIGLLVGIVFGIDKFSKFAKNAKDFVMNNYCPGIEWETND